jgi:tRNA nucleotidyltransferase (CCA-adding enzyme)
MLVVDDAALHNYPLEVRFAALTHDLGKGNTPKDILPRHIDHELRSVDLLKAMCERLRVPADCRDLGLLAARYHGDVHRARELRAETVIRLFQAADAWRRPERFSDLLQACSSDARGRTGHEQDAYPQAEYLMQLLAAARAVGAAVGKNPICFVVPCHRVVGKSGELTGYHWGLTRKRAMLGWEAGMVAA